MGKYNRTTLHDDYSDWHWKMNSTLLKDCHLTDIDKIWVEMRYGKPVAVCDLKRESDTITKTEENLYSWFIKNGLQVFIVKPLNYSGEINLFTSWEVERYSDKVKKIFSCEEYCAWLRRLGEIYGK
jgi:hypothetical protein